MNMLMPDNLKTVDRTPGVLGAVQQLSRMPVDGTPVDGAQAKVGESFKHVLNRRMVVKGAPGRGSASTTGAAKSFAELLNHQNSALGATDESAMAQGESAVGFLNRRHQGTVNEKKMANTSVDATAKAVATRGAAGKQGPRVGETAVQTLNRQKAEDAVADRHAVAEKAAEGLVSNALILPVLKQLRHSTLSEKGLFSAGTGEKTFGPEFDMQLANRIAQSPRLAVKESLVKRLENRPAPVTQGSGFKVGASKTVATSRIDVNG